MPQLRILHIAICLSAAIVLAAFGALRSFGPAAVSVVPGMVAWTLLGFAAMLILSAAAFRTSIPPVEMSTGEEAWVAQYRGKCVALWALCEGGVMLSALAFFFGAGPLVAGVLAAGALGFLASQSPGTLAGH